MNKSFIFNLMRSKLFSISSIVFLHGLNISICCMESESQYEMNRPLRILRKIQEEEPKGLARIVGAIDPLLLNLVNILKNEAGHFNNNTPLPKGILFFGPPGNGKNELVNAIIEETQCPVVRRAGCYFRKKYIEQGPLMVHETFAEAREKAQYAKPGKLKKSIVFIDFIDGLGKKIFDPIDKQNNAIIDAFIDEMDHSDGSVIVMGATDMSHVLEPTLFLPGRIDQAIYCSIPNLQKRIALLKFFGAVWPIHPSVDYKSIAELLPLRAADTVQWLVDRAAENASRSGSDCIMPTHFNRAIQQLRKHEETCRTNFKRILTVSDRERIAAAAKTP